MATYCSMIESKIGGGTRTNTTSIRTTVIVAEKLAANSAVAAYTAIRLARFRVLQGACIRKSDGASAIIAIAVNPDTEPIMK